MARKGKESDVQVYVKTDEEWEKLKETQAGQFSPFSPVCLPGVKWTDRSSIS